MPSSSRAQLEKSRAVSEGYGSVWLQHWTEPRMPWTETARREYRREMPRYASDLTDREWDLVARFIPPRKPVGRPRTTDLREVMNTIFYMATTGCQCDRPIGSRRERMSRRSRRDKHARFAWSSSLFFRGRRHYIPVILVWTDPCPRWITRGDTWLRQFRSRPSEYGCVASRRFEHDCSFLVIQSSRSIGTYVFLINFKIKRMRILCLVLYLPITKANTSKAS